MKAKRAAWVFALSSTVFAACGGGSELDPYDPMTQPSATDGGSVQRACAHCFEDSCAWQTAECASDPTCARWLTCTRDCNAGADGTPDHGCLDGCEQPSALQGQWYRDALKTCFEATGGCCGDANELVDAAAVLEGGKNDAAGDAPYAPTACSTDACEGCLFAMKDGKPCVSDDAVCPGLLTACYHGTDPAGPGHCWSFLLAYGQCATVAPTPDIHACSYDVPPADVGTTAGAMACATRHCPQCIPDPRGACVSCQLASCPDEMRALLLSSAAQDVLWCRSVCEGAADGTACKQACLEGHEELVPTLEGLLSCTQQACGSSCAGVF